MMFLWGVLGGLAPEVVRLYLAVRTEAGADRETRLLSKPIYWLVSIGFLVLAGGIATLLSGGAAHIAFFEGLATPWTIRGLEASATQRDGPLPKGPSTEVFPIETGSSVGGQIRNIIRLL